MAQLHVGRDVLTVLPVHSPVLDNIRNKNPIVTDDSSFGECVSKKYFIYYLSVKTASHRCINCSRKNENRPLLDTFLPPSFSFFNLHKYINPESCKTRHSLFPKLKRRLA